ncbi:MAG: AbrB/MazE/SpoVT family DNA-binding domain-containing protein [Ilumatobacteraceae bacterium]
MELAARMTSKGQITVPKDVRDALGLDEGDSVVFRVDGRRAVIAKTPDFLDLAGSVDVPAARRGAAWSAIARESRVARPRRRR